jgi:hypothetical protein
MPLEVRTENGDIVLAIDTDGDKKVDFWQFQAPGGRKHAIAYADGNGAPGARIELDRIEAAECPHFVILLDGVPFELVAELYRDGWFRFFHPPARVICGYPGMTDLALSEWLHTGRCQGYQALDFNRETNRLGGGSGTYLQASNSPWLAKVDYRCSFWWDGLAYLDPQAVFDHELAGTQRTFRDIDAGEGYAYFVGTAGLGTRGGREAILEYLRTIDRFCEQIIFERRGRVKLTLSADHGHNLVQCRRLSFRETLEAAGFRQTKSLRSPGDVVPIAYGLVTYAALFTQDPAGVASCLIQHEDVEFACYPRGDAVVVRNRSGQATIEQGSSGFIYDSRDGDPLGLDVIIEQLRGEGHVQPDGQIDGRAMFAATVDHDYPDPVARIWSAFHDVVHNPPDLIVNLRDGACHGSRFFHAMIGKVTSTHGSLNRVNSTTFALTNLGELPPAMRSSEVLPRLQELRSVARPAVNEVVPTE